MRAIRAHGRLLAQGQYAACHPGLRYATPRAVFWRPFRARVVGAIKIPGLRPGVALRYTPSCVLAPFQGAGGGGDQNSGVAPRGCATLHPELCSGALSGRGWWGRSNGVRTGILGRGW